MRLLVILLLLAFPSLGETEFVQVPGGRYLVGSSSHERNPRREVSLAAYEISTTEVSNREFSRFIENTDYKTDAEKNGFGMTFDEGMEDWQWSSTPGATWKCPSGPNGEGIADKQDHPVTQISYRDAVAYCEWAGLRLPTAEEWEVAARAGESVEQPYPWGTEFAESGLYHANTWQGTSHEQNSREDGFLYTSPVGSYPPNRWGLYDVIGNVFEYVQPLSTPSGSRKQIANGRGGSWWCSDGTCSFFNLYDIGQQHSRATLCNQGFRVVRDSCL